MFGRYLCQWLRWNESYVVLYAVGYDRCRSLFEMGSKAVEIIDEKQECPDKVEDYYFDTIIKKRETCGCITTGSKETLDLRQRLYETENVKQNREMQFHFMSIHLSECHTINQISDRITYYSYSIPGYGIIVCVFVMILWRMKIRLLIRSRWYCAWR